MATLEEKKRAQEAREARDRQVCKDFLTLTKQNPGAAPYSIFETLAERYKQANTDAGTALFPATTIGVKNLIARNGLYTPTRN